MRPVRIVWRGPGALFAAISSVLQTFCSPFWFPGLLTALPPSKHVRRGGRRVQQSTVIHNEWCVIKSMLLLIVQCRSKLFWPASLEKNTPYHPLLSLARSLSLSLLFVPWRVNDREGTELQAFSTSKHLSEYSCVFGRACDKLEQDERSQCNETRSYDGLLFGC